MPKMKSHGGAKKRYRLTATGIVIRAKCNKNHILTKKNRKRKRRLRQGGYAPETIQKTLSVMVGGRK
ncbi:MAG: 50S ribosomal protein L35 [Christensenellaceae bacterium]|jgi:large subunit ribosomal protein L35|nr:50S ribosomal protein L35 [Christensenellaceae bacterium]